MFCYGVILMWLFLENWLVIDFVFLLEDKNWKLFRFFKEDFFENCIGFKFLLIIYLILILLWEWGY